MVILGLSTWDDSSACIVVDGKLLAAVEEERFTRIKHYAGFPYNAVKYCLDTAGIGIWEVDYVGHYWKPWIVGRRIFHVLKVLPRSARRFKAKSRRGMGEMNEFLTHLRVRPLLTRRFGESAFKLHYIDHHISHACSSYFTSPFDEAAVLTCDGAGESTTTMLAHFEGNKMKIINRIKLPNSLGHLYSAVTAFLGFRIMSGEGKVMGLAAYGDPQRYAREFNNIVSLLPNGEYRVDFNCMDYHLAREGQFSSQTLKVFGRPRHRDEDVNQRHMDIAAGLQDVVEKALIHIAGYLHRKTASKNLCLAGGVALNCSANSRILDSTPFENVHVLPAPGDAGCSLGCAYYINNCIYGGEPDNKASGAYLGPEYGSSDYLRALKQSGLKFRQSDCISREAAELISEGKIVAWFQDAMEFGPRALGNRSILADPRKAEMKEILNMKVKHREWFRPFAPTVLEKHCGEYFKGGIKSSYMSFTDYAHEKAARNIPAAIHIDKSARLQTVNKSDNPKFYELIEEFCKITGVPVVLNTSFNVQGEPIVASPDDALSCFKGTALDYLVLGDYIISKNEYQP
jgi:carbamoyltransferase